MYVIKIIKKTGNHWKLFLGKVKHIFSFSGKISYSFLKTSKTKQKHSPAQVFSWQSNLYYPIIAEWFWILHYLYIHHSSEKCTTGFLILSGIFSILDTESLQKHKLYIEINSKLFHLY